MKPSCSETCYEIAGMNPNASELSGMGLQLAAKSRNETDHVRIARDCRETVHDNTAKKSKASVFGGMFFLIFFEA